MTADIKDHQLLRHVEFDGHQLLVYDTYRTHGLGALTKTLLGYVLIDPDGRVIFAREDFGASPVHAIDSDHVIQGILGFLTLREGDVEDRYWEDHEYTELQFEWRDRYAEDLQMWAMSEDGHPGFTDLRER